MADHLGIVRFGWVVQRLRTTTTAMINMRPVALTWIIEPIIRGLIDRKWTTDRIVLG